MVETYYHWKTPNGENWVGYSIAHNSKEEKIVEDSIKERIRKSKVKTLYKKTKNGKIVRRWNW